MPTKAGTMRSCNRREGNHMSASCEHLTDFTSGQMMSSEATHRMSIAVSSMLVAGGLVAAVSGRPSVHEPETHTEK